jgi:SAM-dependent methyltransferase
MREQAKLATPPDSRLAFVDGTAESLPFDSNSLVAVTAAQAIHWFDRPKFYAEAARVLLPGGALAVIQNNREWSRSAFLDAYETFLETNVEHYTRFYRDLPIEDELSSLTDFGKFEKHSWRWTKPVSPTEFVGLCSSSTKGAQVIMSRGAKPTYANLLKMIDQYYPGAKQIPVDYVAELFLVRRERSSRNDS